MKNTVPNTDQLLEAAKTATPPAIGPGKRQKLYPTVEILIARNFSLAEAVRWLADKKAIESDDIKSCYNSMA